jgi:hypothetical protein
LAAKQVSNAFVDRCAPFKGVEVPESSDDQAPLIGATGTELSDKTGGVCPALVVGRLFITTF